eukprot:SAG22_NODE_16212_length_330_cov_1.636364_1_plen_40_part_10
MEATALASSGSDIGGEATRAIELVNDLRSVGGDFDLDLPR